MFAAALTLWIVKQDELGTPWVRDVIVAVLIAVLLSAAGAVWSNIKCRGFGPRGLGRRSRTVSEWRAPLLLRAGGGQGVMAAQFESQTQSL